MDIQETALAGVLIVTPKRHGDERGFFVETYRADALAEVGVSARFIQDNLARSGPAGVVRGLHFQTAPFAQDKLIRVSNGAIYDVAVDIRAGSPTFGRAFGVELSATNGRQLFVPAGFAHGYCTLTEDAEVAYKVTAAYAPEHEGGLLWNDPALAIDWPVSAAEATLNARDRAWPRLNALALPAGAFAAAQAARLPRNT